MSRIFLTIAAFALFAAACSGDAAVTTITTLATTTTVAATSTTSSTSTTTMPPTTTTTVDLSTTVTTLAEGFASPINGLEAEVTSPLDRRAIGIKIDNHPRARPQSGLLDADSIIEIRVEGGLTRFIAVFHDNESDYLGPTRSVRPTDSSVLAAFPAPLAMSGGQPWIQQIHTGRGIGLISTNEPTGFRISAKVAPHNLYTTTENVRAKADELEFDDDAPQSLYPIVQWNIPETTADKITLPFSDEVTATWDWDGEKYLRTHNGSEHVVVDQEGNSEQMAVDVLVVFAGEFYTAFPPPDQSDWQAVPATETIGSGAAWVFSRGAVWEGTWERSDYSDQFRLLNDDGTEAGVPPGFSWVSIFPDHKTLTWE
jgi:hypothetical protein